MVNLLKRLQNMRWTDKRVNDVLRIMEGQALPDGRTAAYKSKLRKRVRRLQEEAGLRVTRPGGELAVSVEDTEYIIVPPKDAAKVIH